MKQTLLIVMGVALLATAAQAAILTATHDDDSGYVDSAGGMATAFPYAGSLGLDPLTVRSAIFIFELPTLPAGEIITTAKFSAYLEASAVSDPPTGAGENGDLYGLRVNNANTKLVSDAFFGANDGGNTKIMENLVVPSSPINVFYDTGDSAALGTWLAGHYTGIVPNATFVFLRVSVDATPVGSFDLYRFSDNDDPNPPTLMITTIPEPASFGLIAIGGLLITARRR